MLKIGDFGHPKYTNFWANALTFWALLWWGSGPYDVINLAKTKTNRMLEYELDRKWQTPKQRTSAQMILDTHNVQQQHQHQQTKQEDLHNPKQPKQDHKKQQQQLHKQKPP